MGGSIFCRLIARVSHVLLMRWRHWLGDRVAPQGVHTIATATQKMTPDSRARRLVPHAEPTSSLWAYPRIASRASRRRRTMQGAVTQTGSARRPPAADGSTVAEAFRITAREQIGRAS